ncbi:MAG: hypothetical protein ABR555_00475 [Pyrinomonadaceae bacterium]
MKHASNNNIDQLLRRLAKSGPSSATVAPHGTGEHLDADELNSYAEGVVPESARLRYISHVADCDDCRSMIVRLNPSAAWAEPEVEKPSSPLILKTQLRTIFSISRLRYAVPTLAAFVIIVVGLAILRGRQSGNRTTPQPAPVSEGVVQPQNSPGLVDANRSQPTTPLTSASNPKQPEKTNVTTQRQAESQTKDQKAEHRDQPEVAAAAPQPAQEPSASEAKPTATVATESGAAAIQEVKPATVTVVSKEEQQTTGRLDVASASTPKRIQTRPYENREGTGRVAKGDDVSRAKAQKNEESVRVVGGRRFRKEGSGWIDSAYNSSWATTNIARGSEQYRALIADEPEIKTISEQLPGEVIVVWKGRAYRIR